MNAQRALFKLLLLLVPFFVVLISVYLSVEWVESPVQLQTLKAHYPPAGILCLLSTLSGT